MVISYLNKSGWVGSGGRGVSQEMKIEELESGTAMNGTAPRVNSVCVCVCVCVCEEQY